MGLNRWLRDRARTAVDSLFCSSSPHVRRIGDLDSGWVIHTSPLPRVCYCAGVGKGMSFEVELAKLTPQPVLVFDPSPTGIATVAASDTANLRFYPVGLASACRTVEFSVPRDPGEGSYSIAQEGLEKVSFECWDVPTVMARNGDSAVDLLKMDIEGFEYDILDQILTQSVPIRQICVEFHPWLQPNRTLKTMARLHRAGYRLIYKHRGDHTFLRGSAAVVG